MARFIGRIEGSGKETTRLGSPASGIRVEALGWDVGVKVYGDVTALGDVFKVYSCAGSNGRGSMTELGSVWLTDRGVTFTPTEVADPITQGASRYFLDGLAAGRAAGSWVVDGNTTREAAVRMLWDYADGDPVVMDLCPSPLSGEWADGPTPQSLAAEYGVDDADELADVCDEYERGFAEGFWQQALGDARAAAGF